MLFGKINPVAVTATATTPFSIQTINADWMTAIANPYRLGDYTVNFNIYYGNFILDDQNNKIGFKVIMQNICTLTAPATTNWGTDDSYILNQIAIQQGTTITEYDQNDIVVG